MRVGVLKPKLSIQNEARKNEKEKDKNKTTTKKQQQQKKKKKKKKKKNVTRSQGQKIKRGNQKFGYFGKTQKMDGEEEGLVHQHWMTMFLIAWYLQYFFTCIEF